MAAFTLDSLRAAADAKYASMDISLPDSDVCSLRNPLRMDKAERDELLALQERMNSEDEDVDQEALLADALLLIASNKHAARKLLDEIGGDLAVLAATFEAYTEGTQAGEASASAS